MIRRPLMLACVVALLHGLFFIWYQRPDWNTEWTDQDGYRRLGLVLATTGKFTRFPDAPQFVPEVIRTPAYPAFVALLYRGFGPEQLPVALAQTALFVGICLLSYHLARKVAGESTAAIAAAAVAGFSPIPYFGALVMTEVWTTFWFTAAMLLAADAFRRPRVAAFALLGAVIGLTTLSRPVFVLFPFALAALAVALPFLRVNTRPSFTQVAAMLAAFAVTMLPWFLYNYETLGRFTLSPAGGIGRGLWEGSWQAAWPGRLQNELTHLADDIEDRAELDRRVAAVAAREGLPPAPMLEYVHQWEDIRRIWVEPVDPIERARARVVADEEYRRVALQNIRDDSAAHLLKRLARGVFILWAGEIPIRYSEINGLPPIVIRLMWAVQALLMVLAAVGVYRLARAGQVMEACLMASPILYITAVHFPLLTEGRQSLPAMPAVLVLAAAGAAPWLGRSLAFEAKVHEREHL